jgi:hypothetical protein
MKRLEISMKVSRDDGQPESIIYQRSIAVPDGPRFEDWQEQSVGRVKQASDEVAGLLADGAIQSAGA